VRHLLPRVADQKKLVRKQALRGLGNLETTWNSYVAGSASAILSALTSASEDKESNVAAEAVASLTRVCRVVEHETMHPMINNICFRMRAGFDRVRARPTARPPGRRQHSRLRRRASRRCAWRPLCSLESCAASAQTRCASPAEPPPPLVC
jgi:hypothetical protein